MKKLKLKALHLGATEVLSREQLKNVLGGTGSAGSGDGHCKTGKCKLYVSDLGITVDGDCTDFHEGGTIRCSCVNGDYQTDPNTWSACNI
ncbi:hypothetical protein ACTJJ0_26005 [Chitinophaga sp. 22321]|uniref:Natural product n=1 Tax=Chitinophaga hostae TaxID=2831022 RepID=A0ABS5J567_9BACT|nr:hypothetical protein [Chitinophaga hostae]MBS0030356.1 hypothetical protein [Chitinophaga hostae]